MALYVMLTNLTDGGMETLKENPERIKQVNEEVSQKYGLSIKAQYALMGSYDFVNIIEAPDSDSIMKMAIDLGSRGSIRTMTLPAMEIDQLIQDLRQAV